jgi:hypothetical protein
LNISIESRVAEPQSDLGAIAKHSTVIVNNNVANYSVLRTANNKPQKPLQLGLFGTRQGGHHPSVDNSLTRGGLIEGRQPEIRDAYQLPSPAKRVNTRTSESQRFQPIHHLTERRFVQASH